MPPFLRIRLSMTSDKQRFEKLDREVNRLRTKVALSLYRDLSEMSDFREQGLSRLRVVNKKIEKMEQRIFELKHFKLVGTTLDPADVVEIRLLQMLKLEWLEDDNDVDQNDDDADDGVEDEVIMDGEEEVTPVAAGVGGGRGKDNEDDDDDHNDDDNDDDDDDGDKELHKYLGSLVGVGVDVISVSTDTGDSNGILGGRKNKKRKTSMNVIQAQKKLSDFFFRLKIIESPKLYKKQKELANRIDTIKEGQDNLLKKAKMVEQEIHELAKFHAPAPGIMLDDEARKIIDDLPKVEPIMLL
jgi:hypothetical protein